MVGELHLGSGCQALGYDARAVQHHHLFAAAGVHLHHQRRRHHQTYDKYRHQQRGDDKRPLAYALRELASYYQFSILHIEAIFVLGLECSVYGANEYVVHRGHHFGYGAQLAVVVEACYDLAHVVVIGNVYLMLCVSAHDTLALAQQRGVGVQLLSQRSLVAAMRDEEGVASRRATYLCNGA